jgi:type IV pilus assembly protein PilB
MIGNLFLAILAMQVILAAYLLVRRFKEQKLDASKEKDLSQIPGLENEISHLNGELNKIRASYAVATNALAKLEEKKSDISQDLTKQKDTYGAANTDLKQLRLESTHLKNTLLMKEQALETINSKTSTLEKELNEKSDLLQTREQLNKEMAVRVGELESNIEQLKIDFINKQNQTQDRTQLQTQLDSLKGDLEKTRSNYSQAQNELRQLQKKKSDINEDLHKQKDSYEAEKSELEQLKNEGTQLKNALAIKEQELQKTAHQTEALEKKLEEKNNLIGLLEKQNKEMMHSEETLESHIEQLGRDGKTQATTTVEKKPQEETAQVFDEEEQKRKEQIETERTKKKQKIGEILLENNFITQDVLDKALETHNRTGVNLTTFLLTHGYADESEIAQCLCTQFGIPYIPLGAYQISPQIIKLMPVDIAEKYLMIPVDKVGNVLSVVMADPLNTTAIKEVEEITGLKVQVFLSLLSEINDALENYYKITVKGKGAKGKGKAPFFIDTKTYKGPERRDSIRYKAKIGINFSDPEQLKTTQTIDISRSGFLFETDRVIPIGSLVTFQINLPTEVSALPITALARAVRTVPLPNDKFQVGVKIMKISEQELNTIVGYAATHAET